MRSSVLWLTSILIVAGCNIDSGEVLGSPPAGDSARTSSTTDGVTALPCQDMLSTDEDLPEDYEIILDAVALPTADSAPRALQVGRLPDTDPPSYFAKTGLLVRSGAAFDLEVEHPHTATIGWGSPADFSSQISSQGCQGESWIAFAGGFLVPEPMCVQLTLTVNDQEKALFVGAGAACKGQQPPAPT